MDAAQSALNLLQGSPELQDARLPNYLAWCRTAAVAARGSGGDPWVQRALAQARALEDPHWPPHRRFLRAQAEFLASESGSPDSLRLGREALALDLASGSSGHMGRSNLIDAELAAGDARAAARTGEALLADLQGGRGEFLLVFARLNLAAAWLAQDNAVRARSLAQAGWPQGQLFDAQPYWADYLALVAALETRPRAAVRLAGYAAQEDTREANEATAHIRACALARAALSDAEFDRLRADGRLLRDAQIEAIAFATDDTA